MKTNTNELINSLELGNLTAEDLSELDSAALAKLVEELIAKIPTPTSSPSPTQIEKISKTPADYAAQTQKWRDALNISTYGSYADRVKFANEAI